jgi:hypothetical protein
MFLLRDDSLIRGQWTIRAAAPSGDVRGKIIIDLGTVSLYLERPDGSLNQDGKIGDFPIALQIFSIDSTATPKQISLISANQKQPGLYELSETKLRIQLAKLGEPRPTELVKDKAELPAGQLLLELERGLESEVPKETKTE